MQVSAIGPNFAGKRDNVDSIINMDDRTIRDIAYLKAQSKVNLNKKEKSTTALFYSAPLAIGLVSALLDGNKTTLFSKPITGVAGRMVKGAKAAGLAAAILGTADLFVYGRRKLAENSSEVRKFDNNHPLLSMITTLTAGLGIVLGVKKGISKLGASIKVSKSIQKATQKAANAINKNSWVIKAKNSVNKLAQKTPDALKDIGATALVWSPAALLLGGLFNSLNARTDINREFAKNYEELRNRQIKLSSARVNELVLENDFLKQDIENREDLKILKDNMADLPDEVVEKVLELQQDELD